MEIIVYFPSSPTYKARITSQNFSIKSWVFVLCECVLCMDDDGSVSHNEKHSISVRSILPRCTCSMTVPGAVVMHSIPHPETLIWFLFTRWGEFCAEEQSWKWVP